MVSFGHIIGTVDAHTGGESVRVVLSGLPFIYGNTMAEKKDYLKNNLDHFRTLLMQEPRGHNDMFGVLITPPCTDRVQYGVLFMDNDGYLDMCGHSIIGATTVLIETGMCPSGGLDTSIVFDTPAGLVTSLAKIENGRVVSVSFKNVPSYLYAENLTINTSALGPVRCDIAFGGNFFVAVDVASLGLSLCQDNLHTLLHLGVEIKRAVNEKIEIKHSSHAHIDRVELTEFYERTDPTKPFTKSLVVFGAGQFDRSPCGTGVSATMATLYVKGELELHTEFVAESIIGTRFKGKLNKTLRVNSFRAVEPSITGRSYLTGIRQFLLDPNDSVGPGFKVS